MRDKRNRFQVNRVDSVATGNHSPKTEQSATLVGYKEYSNGGSSNGGAVIATGEGKSPIWNLESVVTPASFVLAINFINH